MFFLVRMTFWLGLVLVLLPFGSTQHNSPGNEVSASEAISAASATVGDLRGFCGRQPDACSVGSQVASAIGYRAQAGAKILYEALSEAMAPRDTGSVGTSVAKNTVGKIGRRKIRGRTRFAKHLDACRYRARLARSAGAQGRQARRLNGWQRQQHRRWRVPRSI